MIEFEMDKVHKIALVIGVGDGACKALNNVYLKSDPNLTDFLAINTNRQALEKLDIPLTNQLLIGSETTKGMGCGGDCDLGRESAIESTLEIVKHISNGYKIVFILTALGGGTGTGASPVISGLCREAGSLVISVVSMPHKLEGEYRQIHAKNGIDSLCKISDAVFLFQNDQIIPTRNFENYSLSVSFEVSDITFQKPIEIILDILINKGYINIDFDDLASTLGATNAISSIISGTGSGNERITEALQGLYNSPYLSTNEMNVPEKILVCFEFGSDPEFTMNEIGEVIDSLQDKFGFNTEIVWGNCFNPKLSNHIRISAIVV